MSKCAVDAVVMGASPTGLYALRELASAGFSVACVDTVSGCAAHSRHVRGKGRWFQGNAQAMEAWLLALASTQQAKPVLIPTNDVSIEFILERAAVLQQGFRFPPAYQGMASHLLDKTAFHALCQTHGVATPGVWSAESRAVLAGLGSEIPFPCILKPALIHKARRFLNGKKVLLARNRAEFEHHVARMPDDVGGWLVQEIIPGPESAITLFGGYVSTNGKACQTFTGRKLRQHPAGFGSASLVTSQPCGETMALTLDFLHRLDFRGVCGAEFKRDPRDGQLKIIEINPRPTLWFQLAHDAGKRIVEAAVRDLRGEGLPAEQVQDAAVRWRYALKDAASIAFYGRNAKRFIFPQPDISSAATARKRSWPVYSADDPMPAIWEPLGYLRKAWGRM